MKKYRVYNANTNRARRFYTQIEPMNYFRTIKRGMVESGKWIIASKI